ncbi:GNAT family N-acetyltransferase [Primorskyibacter sp. S187A]|uniref:GNAT family N-acetyltransferase n=1 Tax=Primorskyibacter sp. S187A TaxID=3415130 RepID=UPI003C7B1E32
MQLRFEEVLSTDASFDALLQRHFDLMRASSPEESCHVMSADQLRAEGARVFAGRDNDGRAWAIGAFLDIGENRAELKSMHCHDALRGQGAGRALLAHLMAAARSEGMTSLWLETGSAPEFLPAQKLYARAGFEPCPPFGSYKEDPLSLFMTRPLTAYQN